MLPQLSKIRGVALNLLFPQKCVGCGEEGGLLCHSCVRSLPRINPPFCPKCGRPQSSGIICPACVSWQTSIAGIRSPLKFESVAREAIHQLKYKNLRTMAQPLASLLGEYFLKYPLPVEVIVPVPLHPQREKQRGYNQSVLLASELSKIIHLPVVNNCLKRTKFMLPQAQTKSVEERRRNVMQAFACVNSALTGKAVLLIDDVATSGSTLDSCASALKSAGVTSVWGLIVAREIYNKK